jgi:hypothetical protein
MEWIDKHGSLFSFLGLILTLLTFAGVIWNKRILKVLNKKNFKVNRMPENLSDLKEISDKISDLLIVFEQNKTDLKSEISKIQPILKSLTKSLSNNEMDNLTLLKNSINRIDSWTYEGEEKKWYKKIFSKQKEMTKVMVNEVDIKLTRLITDIDNIGRDHNKNLL